MAKIFMLTKPSCAGISFNELKTQLEHPGSNSRSSGGSGGGNGGG
eukprot:CAMPEP_0172908162 /NCGR_PEP_ID=MMETSP1075-20121228/180207_1 /TAXON_ID=2916 /ORGANISM="Ceratium fusus, Strain PA161109" /LENGTH=44 /DNA_ID= /DNA_START= /DNA_END= /DNA_ORIENTATION=